MRCQQGAAHPICIPVSAPALEACRAHVVPGEVESACFSLLSPVTQGHNMMQKESFPLTSYVRAAAIPALHRE